MSGREAVGSGPANKRLRNRIVEPEILDSLSPNDPIALASRRDIWILNHLMGNFRWMGKALAALPERSSIIELAAGDGAMGLYLLKHKIVSLEDRYTGVDFINRPDEWPEQWDWMSSDLMQADLSRYQVLLANLILHQLEDEQLQAVGDCIRASTIKHVLICEPSRSRLSLFMIPFSRLLRVHPVTLHDARVSIRAGFRGRELAGLLGLDEREWNIHYSKGLFGSYRLACTRR
ncbi:MAG TPA: hypothetical protein VK995_00845 [Oceanipulchritudo sp.]|nr:hypothetical protein [Oceanipulchritudo sp.]